MNIYLDIETIPTQNPEARAAIAAGITAPANYSKPESIAKWLEENREAEAEKAWRRTSFDGALGQIAVVSVAIDNDAPMTFWSDDWTNHEPAILRELFQLIDDARAVPAFGNVRAEREPVFIGHNLVGFDLRFLFQRAVLNGIRPSACIPFQAKPWDSKVYDTMVAWAGHNGRVSLDKLCSALGLAAKGSEIGEEIDGSLVWDFVRAGRIADVATYCAADVERVREIHKRMTFWSEAA